MTGYEVVRDGCATGWDQCPHGSDAVTVYRLDDKGRRKPGGTVCVHLLEIVPQS